MIFLLFRIQLNSFAIQFQRNWFLFNYEVSCVHVCMQAYLVICERLLRIAQGRL